MTTSPNTLAALTRHFRAICDDNLPYHWLENWLLFILDKDKSYLITDGDHVLSDDEYARVQDGITKMKHGTPPAYLIGRQGFFGYEFIVNEHTLIPRPDTETLVVAVLDVAKNITNPKILDLGTGTGCIAISLAKAVPSADVVAVDLSDDALAVAMQNAHQLGADNCTFISSNWYEHVAGQFDIIVSNPPYIDKDDTHLDRLSAEPISALVADNQGLSDIQIIIDGARRHLTHGGTLAIEHGYEQGGAVQALFKQANFTDIITHQDHGANDRVTMGVYHG